MKSIFYVFLGEPKRIKCCAEGGASEFALSECKDQKQIFVLDLEIDNEATRKVAVSILGSTFAQATFKQR